MRSFGAILSLVLLAIVTPIPSLAQNQQPAPPKGTTPAQLAPKMVPDQVQLFIPYQEYSQ
jgi:hypothetical protein